MSTSRRNFIKNTGLSLGLASLSGSQFLNSLFDQNGYNMKVLRGNVGIFTERGGTILWMADAQGMAVVDTQFPAQAGHLIAELKKKSDRKVDALINTHHHGDHSAGNSAFKGLAEKVIAHENSLKNQKRVAEARNQLDNQLLPDTTYSKGKFSEKVGKERITLRYFGPGHTDGDSVVHFENSNIAHMGDLLFNRRVPYIDKSSGANITNWQVIMEKTYKAVDKDTLMVYGHSGDGYDITGTREDLKAFQNYLSKVMDFVKKGVDAGKSQEELVKATSIPGADQWKGNQQRAVAAAWMEIVDGK